MNKKRIYKQLHIILAVFGILSFGWWFIFNPADSLNKKMPGMDKRPAGALKNASVNFGAYYQKFDGKASSLKGSWPNFRGGNRDNICNDNIALADSWGKSGPKVLWSVDLGEGHSGPIISDGKVYVFDYDETRRADVLRCFSFEDGKEIWRVGYDIYLKRNHGISRTVPAIKDKYVVTIGPNCQIMCVNADSGKVNWGIDLARDFETEVPLWYTGQCPMIDDSLVIVGVGGKSLVTAFSLKTGKVVWETPNPNKWKMSHSSIIKFNLGEEKIYLYAALGGVVGVSSEGKVLFETTLFNHNVVAPTPVYLGNGRVFLTAGYGAGSSTIKIEKTASGYTVKGLQKIQPTEGMASEQQTPILYNGLIYSIQPKDAGSL
ncbi:MAG: PQQ-binding-like beta-propeller repeat protein, partial [Bacteroidetes bacterium]|nr:PQQ-binding-like beta-propeller repeat protein [Bacteroidota bacterium]